MLINLMLKNINYKKFLICYVKNVVRCIKTKQKEKNKMDKSAEITLGIRNGNKFFKYSINVVG